MGPDNSASRWLPHTDGKWVLAVGRGPQFPTRALFESSHDTVVLLLE